MELGSSFVNNLYHNIEEALYYSSFNKTVVESLVKISGLGSPELKKVFFTKCLYMSTVYSALKRKLLDRFPPTLQGISTKPV